MSTQTVPAPIEPIRFTDALSQRYLAYALSTITARSLPDVRDGLKPVQRRILYAMLKLRLDPEGGYKKCARVVGDVIGKFHPHGEGAIYDGGDEEPVVLPGAFPNLLANGTSGIAVGMATSIPPHNAGELCAALPRLLEQPETPLEALLEVVKGPDLPTGGGLVEPWPNVIEAYRSGRGSLRLRARWQPEDQSHGQYQVVVTEIPYQVPKSRLIERIAELLAAKRLPLLADVRDESAEEVPRVMGFKEVLRAFLEHRMVVLIRRSRHRLARIEERLEVLAAYQIAYLNLDEVIRIIREEDEPKAELMRAFELTERQAEAILNMRLRHLRRLEERTLLKEQRELKAERREIKELLKDEAKRRAKLTDEIEEVGRKFGDGPLGRRRTALGAAPVIDGEALEVPVERQPVTVVCSRQGWIRVLRGHVEGGGADIKYKEGDAPRFLLHGQSTDRLLLISSDGRGYLLPIERLPGGRGQGEPLRLQIDLARGAEPLMLAIHRQDGRVLLASSGARGFLAEEQAIAAQTRGGKQVFNLEQDERVVVACPAEGDHVATVGSNRKMLVFPLDQLPVMSRGKGVLLQRYRDGGLADARVFALADGLSWPTAKGLRVITDLAPWLGKRGQAGRMAPHGFPRNNRFGD